MLDAISHGADANYDGNANNGATDADADDADETGDANTYNDADPRSSCVALASSPSQ